VSPHPLNLNRGGARVLIQALVLFAALSVGVKRLLAAIGLEIPRIPVPYGRSFIYNVLDLTLALAAVIVMGLRFASAGLALLLVRLGGSAGASARG
jgi:hypothetical protein